MNKLTDTLKLSDTLSESEGVRANVSGAEVIVKYAEKSLSENDNGIIQIPRNS